MGKLRGRVISTWTAADLAGVSPDTVRRWAHEGLLPDGIVFRLTPRGRLMVKRDEFVAWLEERQEAPLWEGDQALLFHK